MTPDLERQIHEMAEDNIRLLRIVQQLTKDIARLRAQMITLYFYDDRPPLVSYSKPAAPERSRD